MNEKQFNIITSQRFSRLNAPTIDACRSVVLQGKSAYEAEKAFNCPAGTVSRYVNKIHAELAFCEQVAAYAKEN